MPKVNGRDIFETKPWLNDDPQNIEQYSAMVEASAPSGTIEISANGEYDVSEYATADVQVEGGGSSDLSTAEVTFTCTGGEGYVASCGVFGESGDSVFVIGESADGAYIKTENIYVGASYGTPTTNKIYTISGYDIIIANNGEAPSADLYTVTGNAVVENMSDDPSSPFYAVRVTGDCTISMVGTNL